MDEEEIALLFDLAGIDRGIDPLDLLDYTLNNAYVRVALRKAKKKRIINKMWRDFIDSVEGMQGANLT